MLKRACQSISVPWKNYLTVEPGYLLFCLGFYLMDLVNTNLYIQKTCRVNSTTEPDMHTDCDDEKAGISFVTSVNLKYRFAVRISHTFVSIFMCAWSDRTGNRKLFIILPIVALILHLLALCYQTYYWTCPVDVAVWSEVFFQVLIGGNSLINTFAKINIFETSSEENRTLRTTILVAVQTMSIPISSGLSGFLMQNLGFLRTYVCCVVLAIGSLILTCLFVKNTVVPKSNDDMCNVFLTLPEALKMVFRRRPSHERFSIWLLLLISTGIWFVSTGERSIIYFFFRSKFHWNEKIYGYYLTYKLIGSIFGTLFCSIILSKKLKLHDGLIGAIASFCLTFAAFGYLLARNTWEVFIVPLFEIFGGVALTICDSFLSKFFTNEEFGRLFAVHMVFDIISAVGIPVYSLIFSKTMEEFPSAYNFLSIPINFAVAILYSITFILSRKFSEAKTKSETMEKGKSIDR